MPNSNLFTFKFYRQECSEHVEICVPGGQYNVFFEIEILKVE